MKFPCLGVLAVLQGLLSGQEAPPQPKVPVPEKAVQERLGKQIRELFKEDYARRGRPARKALAERLLAEAGPSLSDNDSRFMLLVEAKDLAVEAMEPDLALDTVRKIVARYDLGSKQTPGDFRIETLDPARKSVKTPEEARTLAGAYVRASRESLAEDDYAGAAEAARHAGTLARSARNAAAAREAEDLAKEVDSLKREFGEAQKAEGRLAENPNDPEANLALGLYLCFVKGNWEKGLPRLSRGSDAGLQAVADREMARPAEPGAQAELGDAWYEAAQKEKKPPLRDRCLGRAREWYQTALGGLQGVARLKVQKRLDEMSRQGVRSGRIPVTQGLIGAWNLDEGRGTAIADSSPHGNAGVLMNAGPGGGWSARSPFSRPVLSLDGVDDYVKIEGDRTWNTLDRELTIAAWVCMEKSFPGYRGVVTRQIEGGSGNYFYFGVLNGKFMCYLTVATVSDPLDFPASQWVHMAFTGDGSTLRLYRDGKEVSSLKATVTYAKDSNPVIIGGDRNVEGGPVTENFAGQVARVRLYNRALGAAEIALLAQADR